jgi:hypothetical protein
LEDIPAGFDAVQIQGMISTGRRRSEEGRIKGDRKKEDDVKRGLSFLVGVILILTSYGCIVERRDDQYRRDHEQYRQHEEHRNGDHERDSDEHRGGDEQRDYDQY